MDFKTSFDFNSLREFKVENSYSGSIENIADQLDFKVVWQQSGVDMMMVNEFMNQLDIYDENDQTPSNISALLSSSFPSGVSDQDKMEVDVKSERTAPQFLSSTPYSKDTMEDACRSFDITAFEEFNKASPIFNPPTRRTIVLTKKRLHYSCEDFSVEKNCKVLKT